MSDLRRDAERLEEYGPNMTDTMPFVLAEVGRD